jgi:hypothetical protein
LRMETAHQVDMAVFVHPNILDVQHWGCRLTELGCERETFVPLATMRATLTADAMSKSWKEVLGAVLARLRPGGRLVFVFYERREQELMQRHLTEERGGESETAT